MDSLRLSRARKAFVLKHGEEKMPVLAAAGFADWIAAHNFIAIMNRPLALPARLDFVHNTVHICVHIPPCDR